MNTHQDRVIWIIGAGSGIGAALAKTLDRQGARLILSARNPQALQTVNAALTTPAHIQAFDVSDAQATLAATDAVFAACPVVHSVVFMAAIYEPANLVSLQPEQVQTLMNVNFMGAFHVVHAILPHLNQQNGGQIALCGSVAGYRGMPNGQPYSASKAALMSLAESLRCEVAHHHIDVKLISPGFVKTPMTDKNHFYMPMMIQPEAAAEHIANGLLTRQFEIRFPFVFTTLVRLLRLLPDAIYYPLFTRR